MSNIEFPEPNNSKTILSPEKRIELAATIMAGLFASGHYTNMNPGSIPGMKALYPEHPACAAISALTALNDLEALLLYGSN